MKDAIKDSAAITKHELWIECPPEECDTRFLLASVLAGTEVQLNKHVRLTVGLRLEEGNPKSGVYVGARWPIPAEQAEAYRQARPMIRRRLMQLYKKGIIRAAKW